MSTNAYAKFHCTALCIKKDLGIFRELITTRRTTTTRVAFWDPTSGSKNGNRTMKNWPPPGRECPSYSRLPPNNQRSKTRYWNIYACPKIHSNL